MATSTEAEKGGIGLVELCEADEEAVEENGLTNACKADGACEADEGRRIEVVVATLEEGGGGGGRLGGRARVSV
jgi:hypothetical protein